MRIIDRLDMYMKYKELNDNLVTKKVGLSHGLLMKSRQEGKDLSLKQVDKILSHFPDLNGIWVKSGTGEMLKTISIDIPIEGQQALPSKLVIPAENNNYIVQLLLDKILFLASENTILNEKVLHYEEELRNLKSTSVTQ